MEKQQQTKPGDKFCLGRISVCAQGRRKEGKKRDSILCTRMKNGYDDVNKEAFVGKSLTQKEEEKNRQSFGKAGVRGRR